MPQILRRLLLIPVFLTACAFVVSDRSPVTSYFVVNANARPLDEPQNNGPLTVRLFAKVIRYINDNYVDPKRIKPKEMLVAALEYVEKTVPDVLVDGNADSSKVKVSV